MTMNLLSSRTFSTLLALAFFASLPLLAAGAFPSAPGESQQVAKTEKPALDAKDPQYWIAKARDAMEAKKWLNAEKYLKKAKKIDPELAEAYRLLGDLHATLNRDWKADKFYEKARELETLQASKN